MSDLKQREREFEAQAERINAGRKPKFGDLMRNPLASEGNPQRDGYFVREICRTGLVNSGLYYEFTDAKGKFWQSRAQFAFCIDAQPSADKFDALHASLGRLAMALWRAHYQNDSPDFQLLPDATGILSQIDNMVSGLVRPASEQPQDERVAAGHFIMSSGGEWRQVDKTYADKATILYHAKGWPCTQPEATAPAQDLSAAILAIDIPSKCLTHQASVYGFKEGLKAAAAIASSANALSAGDRVDAERYRALRARVGSDHKHHTQRAIEVIVSDWGRSFGRTDINAGVWCMNTIDGDELDAAIDSAILQSQKAK